MRQPPPLGGTTVFYYHAVYQKKHPYPHSISCYASVTLSIDWIRSTDNLPDQAVDKNLLMCYIKNHVSCTIILISDGQLRLNYIKGYAAVDTMTLGERVYQTLREKILQGEYKPGRKFNIDQIARDLGVSNTPIREALARLERLGLVEMVPYCGPKIKRLNAAHLKDIYDVRIALEVLAVRLAIQSEGTDVFKGMAAALEMQELASHGDDPRAVMDADRAFHDTLVQASGNSVLLEMLPNLSDRTRLLLELNTPPSERMDKAAALRILQDHRRIYEALLEGNQETAVQELRQQLFRGRDQLMEKMSKQEAI